MFLPDAVRVTAMRSQVVVSFGGDTVEDVQLLRPCEDEGPEVQVEGDDVDKVFILSHKGTKLRVAPNSFQGGRRVWIVMTTRWPM
jgi:hypothetical protein